MKQLLLALLITGSAISESPEIDLNNNETVVVLDLHGVVITTNKRAAFKLLGGFNLLKLAWKEHLNPKNLSKYLKKRLYQLLDTIKPRIEQNNLLAPQDDEGNIVPQLMEDLLNGSLPPAAILDAVKDFAQDNPSWFKSRIEHILLNNLAKMIFTPKLFVHIHDLRPEARQFVKECKLKGYRVGILSNWDSESFELIKEKYPDFFALFNPEDICISGTKHCSKPDPCIYTFFDTFSTKPENIWFIDDQEVNLMTPQSMGIRTILYKPKKTFGGLHTKFPRFPVIRKAPDLEHKQHVSMQQISLSNS